MSLLAAIIESTDDAIYTQSPDAVITSWNGAAERIYGYRPEEAIGQPIAMLIPGDRVGEDIRILAQILGGERIDHYETERVRKDGARVRVSLTVSPLHASDGSVAGASVIARDVTARRAAEDAKTLLAAVVDSSDDAIYTKSATGVITSWNRAAARMYGYAEEEAVGRPVAMLIPPHRSGEDTMILASILRGERVEHFETERLGKDGQLVPVSVTASPLCTEDGEVLGASIIARDVSDRRRADLERARYLAALEDYNAIIAHDLAEPVRTIAGFADWLVLRHGAALEGRAREALEQMKQSADRMQALIVGLREYARLGETELRQDRVALGAVVEETLTGLGERLRESGADVRVAQLPEVCGDGVLLGQLVQNLVANAVKFRAPERPPVIEIDAVADGDAHVLRVADNGIGIPAEFGGRIFGMYQRLQPRERYEGIGVGLAVARRIAERHGGRIWFEPRAEGGTRFCVSLPAAPGA